MGIGYTEEKRKEESIGMKKKRVASILLILAVILLAAGGLKLYSDNQKRAAAEREYESLAELARQTEAETTVAETETETVAETEAPYVSPIQFDELRRINPDIVGWLKIEDTEIDYPIVQTGNNETYLNTDFEGKKSVAGAIYLDYECEPDFSGRHNIIYGHNMKNGSMFKDIVKYKDEAYFNEHQIITVYTPEREYHLRPMSALYTDPSGMRRKTKFTTEESFQAYVEEMTKGCAFGQKPEEPLGQIWSFITCSYEFNDARTILYAYEVTEE